MRTTLLPNIHRFKIISLTLSNKHFLIWLLSTPPHLKYVATPPFNLSLVACFAETDDSQGSVATYVRSGRMLNIEITANLLRNRPLKKISKSAKIRQKYGHESVVPFFGPPCRYRNPVRGGPSHGYW